MADAKFARPVAEQISRLRQRQTAPLILELDLTDGVPDGPVTDPLSAVLSLRKIRLPDLIEGLRRARQERLDAEAASAGAASERERLQWVAEELKELAPEPVVEQVTIDFLDQYLAGSHVMISAMQGAGNVAGVSSLVGAGVPPQ